MSAQRTADGLRTLSLQWGGLGRADGSARFAFGTAKAVASVSAPIEVRLATELPSRATVEVNARPVSGVPGTSERAFSKKLRDILEQILFLTNHPRTLVQITIQALSPNPNRSTIDPPLVASMINASSLALLHAASISMRGVLVAVAVGRSKIGGQLILDPEEGTCERAGCFGFVINESEKDGDVVWAEWNGAFDEDEYLRACELARKGAKSVLAFFRKELDRRLRGDGDRMNTS